MTSGKWDRIGPTSTKKEIGNRWRENEVERDRGCLEMRRGAENENLVLCAVGEICTIKSYCLLDAVQCSMVADAWKLLSAVSNRGNYFEVRYFRHSTKIV